MSRRVLAALAATTLMLGAAACGNEGDGPVTTPPATVDNGPSDDGGASQEPSDGGGEEETDAPTVAAPDVPAPDPADYPGMDEETPEGAEQALRYYIAVVYWGYQTGETETLETLHQDTCGTCMGFSEDIQEIREAGAYWGEASVTDFGVTTFDAPDFDIEVGYIYTIGEHQEPAQGSGEMTATPKANYTAAAGLLWNESIWIVGGLNITETEIDID